MKRIFSTLLSTIIIILFFTSCGKKEKNNKVYIRPVKTAIVTSTSSEDKQYAGTVEAVNFADLAFKVNGQIVKMYVKEGQQVKQGALLAQLNPKDFDISLSVSKSSLKTAENQYRRAKELNNVGNISTQEYELALLNLTKAQASFDNANEDREQTELRAPFSGFIESKYAENFQQISAGSKILKLVSPNNIRIKFLLPESKYETLNSPNTFSVSFDVIKDKSFSARIQEYVEISSRGAGVPIYLIIDNEQELIKKYNIKPGFSCTVHMKTNSKVSLGETQVNVPFSAIFSDGIANNNYVWVVEDNICNKRKVTLGDIKGSNMASVIDGLTEGEEVVSAGVQQITEGKKVKILR